MKTAHKILIAVGVLAAYFGLILSIRADPPARKLMNYSLNVSNSWSTAGATNLTHFFVDSAQVCVYLANSNTAANTSNTVVTLNFTPDGVLTAAAPTLTMALANTGTIGNSVVSNLNVGGASEVFITVTAAGTSFASTFTNFVTLIFSQKSGL